MKIMAALIQEPACIYIPGLISSNQYSPYSDIQKHYHINMDMVSLSLRYLKCIEFNDTSARRLVGFSWTLFRKHSFTATRTLL